MEVFCERPKNMTTLDLIQKRNEITCKKEASEKLKEALLVRDDIIISLDKELISFCQNHELSIRKDPGCPDLVLAGAEDVFPEIKERGRFEAVLAAYVTGIRSIESVIFNGAYIQASALIRQEFEAIAQLLNILNGQAETGRAPGIRLLETQYKKLYSELTTFTHLCRHDSLGPAFKGTRNLDSISTPLGYNLFCEYDEGFSFALLVLHCASLVECIHCIYKYLDKYSSVMVSDIYSINTSYNKLVDLAPGLELQKKPVLQS